MNMPASSTVDPRASLTRERMISPFVSIIIPTRNRPANLLRCLELLIPQMPADFELHVCDDSSGPETRNMLKQNFPFVACHPGSRRGPGANRNLGAQVTRGHWLIFLDDDCLPNSKLVASYHSAMQSAGPEANIVFAGHTYRLDEHKDSLLWEAPSNSTDHSLPPSCNFALPRALFFKAGGFDERYTTSFEDMEFFARLGLMGVPVRYLTGAAVEHPSRPISSPCTLARRWEARVISSYDFGGLSHQILWRLPQHILLVILSRFRKRTLTGETLRAAIVFSGEFLTTLWLLPGWLFKYHRAPRSPFWIDQVAAGNAPPRLGL